MDLPLPHKLTLREGTCLTVTGVTEVLSFDDTAALVRTPLGLLTIHGENLQLKTLSADGGQTLIEGTVTALVYDQPKKSGLLSRLLR